MTKKIIELPKPYIVTINQDGKITRDYNFSISQSSDRRLPKGNTIDDYRIEASVYRYIRRKCDMSDGSKRTFTEEDDPKHMFYTLIVQTQKSFAESIELFRSLGVTGGAEIPILRYGDNSVMNVGDSHFDKLMKMARGEEHIPHKSRSIYNADEIDENTTYHQTPFTFGDLDDKFIRDVNSCQDAILLRVHCEDGTGLEGVALFYEQRKERGHFGREETKREIAYMDDKIVKPRFDKILDVAPFQLNSNEKELLEEMINRGLQL